MLLLAILFHLATAYPASPTSNQVDHTAPLVRTRRSVTGFRGKQSREFSNYAKEYIRLSFTKKDFHPIFNKRTKYNVRTFPFFDEVNSL